MIRLSDNVRTGVLAGVLVMAMAVGMVSSAAALLPGASAMLAPEGASGWTPKPLWRGQRHAVAAAHPLAARAGADVLEAGGTAVDAAIAVQMVLTLVEPQSSGIGGGAFLLLADGPRVWAYDGRETAPAAAEGRMFLQPDGRPLPFADAAASGLSVGVPGVVAMLEAAHRAHGRLPWGRLIAPAIVLAEGGFEVSPRLHTLLAADDRLRTDPEAAAYFFDPQGKPWPVGHRLRNPALAETLRCIAARGASCLQDGEVAEAIVRKVQRHPQRPGRLTLADLASYRPVLREPLCHPWRTGQRSLRVCGFPPPSSGALAIGQLLGILQHLPRSTPYSVDFIHGYAEASRLAFADRARYVADPDFVAAPGGDWAHLLRPDYLRQRAGLIGPAAMRLVTAGEPVAGLVSAGDMPDQPERGTSHLSIVDADGRAVSMTTTIETAFGSRMMVGGFLLNNQLTDFSFTPEDAQGRPIANRVEPGKRPRSSMSPTLVWDGDTGQWLAAVGSPGGALIIHYTARALLAIHDWGQTAQQAAELPHLGSLGGPLLLETGRYPPATAHALRARGHEVRETGMTSGLHLLVRTARGLEGGADPRREGIVVGR